MRRTVQGIVLREINYKEADKILTVLTREEGKLTIKARGCRRKNSRLLASSQLLVYSALAITQRGEFITLAEGDPLTQFRRLGEDIDKLALASYFAEVTEKTVQEGEVCPDILSLLLNCLYALDTLDKPLEQVDARDALPERNAHLLRRPNDRGAVGVDQGALVDDGRELGIGLHQVDLGGIDDDVLGRNAIRNDLLDFIDRLV